MSVTTLPPRVVAPRQPGWIARLFDYKPFLIVMCLTPAIGLLGGVPHLPARPRRLARLHRHHHRPARRLRRPGEFPVSADRSAVVERGVLQRFLHRGRDLRKIRARLLAGAAAQQPLPAQEPVARHRAAAVDRADGAVGAGVLVDLRSAVLDHLLSAGRRAARPHHQYRLPGNAVAGAVLADRRQHLARHPLRRDLAARGPADHLALAL